MTDTITLTGLRLTGTHGVLPQERTAPQEFVVDVSLGLDLAPAGISDDLADTVDYAAVADVAAAVVGGPSVDLVETLAARVAHGVLADPRVVWVEVTVHKPQAPVPHAFADVAVTVRREHPADVVPAAGTVG